jgi:hypothetical protein
MTHSATTLGLLAVLAAALTSWMTILLRRRRARRSRRAPAEILFFTQFAGRAGSPASDRPAARSWKDNS